MTTTFPAWLSAYLRIPMALAVVLLTLHCAHCRLWGRKDLGTSGNETELTETSIEALSTSRLYSLYILCTNFRETLIIMYYHTSGPNLYGGVRIIFLTSILASCGEACKM